MLRQLDLALQQADGPDLRVAAWLLTKILIDTLFEHLGPIGPEALLGFAPTLIHFLKLFGGFECLRRYALHCRQIIAPASDILDWSLNALLRISSPMDTTCSWQSNCEFGAWC